MRQATTALVIVLTSIAISGCSSDSTSGNGTTNFKSPGVGSTFTYGTRLSNGFEDSLWTFRDTVIATGITQYGKTNVTQYAHREPHGFEFLYEFVNYESNGDISYYLASGQDPDNGKWILIPLASKGTRTSESYIPDGEVRYSYTGTKPWVVDGKTLNSASFEFKHGSKPVESGSPHRLDTYDLATGIAVNFAGLGGSDDSLRLISFDLK